MNITRFRKMMVDSFDCATRGAACIPRGACVIAVSDGAPSHTQSTNL